MTKCAMRCLPAYVALVFVLGTAARGQLVIDPNLNNNIGNIGGVYIDPDGVVRFREADGQAELERIRALAKNVGKDEKLRFVSLARALEQARQCAADGKPVPEEVKYLGGLTRLQYVLVFEDDKDLILAGPGEDWDAKNPLQPHGLRTGRPVMQLDDLVVALRLGGTKGDIPPFGCSIDAEGDMMARAKPVLDRFQRGPRDRMAEEIKKAVGPQKVTVFGAAANTRLALVSVAADYKMKRMSLGIDPSIVGHAVAGSREAAGNRFWFETSYEPLLVSANADAYELRGPRLAIKAGTLMFQEKGATDAAKAWAKRFNEKMPAMAASTPLFADLQNIADLSVLAALIRADNLDQRAGLNLGWLSDPKAYVVPSVSVPRQAETLVAVKSGSLVVGGVQVSPTPFIGRDQRQPDDRGDLGKIRQLYSKLRPAAGSKVTASE